MNNSAHAEQRSEAIAIALERDSQAFQPKIATSPHPLKGATAARAHAAGGAAATAGGAWTASAAAPTDAAEGVSLQVRQVHHKGCRCKKTHCLKKSPHMDNAA